MKRYLSVKLLTLLFLSLKENVSLRRRDIFSVRGHACHVNLRTHKFIFWKHGSVRETAYPSLCEKKFLSVRKHVSLCVPEREREHVSGLPFIGRNFLTEFFCSHSIFYPSNAMSLGWGANESASQRGATSEGVTECGSYWMMELTEWGSRWMREPLNVGVTECGSHWMREPVNEGATGWGSHWMWESLNVGATEWGSQ